LSIFNFGIFPFFAITENINYMLKRILVLLAFSFVSSSILFAQVTTSSITGTVKGDNGQLLAGATVTAVHLPSGTQYSTISSKDGVFNLPGLRVGGPYQVTIAVV
jgi:hypothetical protein